ncbi:DUF2334 domain-containing protein [Coraliomargarita sp. SDUM461003]|uniref:DUF2334 domain-containing protein n=1 Tax=Thalassobacterium maritimum TaxID=3041265 RepID=A0ABU1AXK3_9BACT|nr:DUF2334 domain-containing protein [Coraliomargarita sp. SDUM461003]MDQ8208890.1 DUF2334 domain-containing protein [Coraliomargarita sp. SDUM461003]
MKKRFLSLCVCCLACVQFQAFAAPASDNQSEVSIILKLDDMQQKRGAIPATWQRVYDYAGQRGIPFSAGVICNSLEGEAPEYFESLKAWEASGRVELWNHGYDHKMWNEGETRIREFKGSGYEHQFKHMQRSQELGREKLGLTFVTFGAPFNGTDADTEKVLARMPGLKVWLYGARREQLSLHVLKRNYKLNLEPKTGQLDYGQFTAAYLSQSPGNVLVLQGHPMLWDDAEFEVFKQIIEFLEAQKVRFILPRDCIAQ